MAGYRLSAITSRLFSLASLSEFAFTLSAGRRVMHKTLFDMKSIIRTVDKIIYKRIKSVWRRRINVDMKTERERPHGAMTSSGKS